MSSLAYGMPTIEHYKCGLIFSYVDGTLPKRYSSRTELKGIVMSFAMKKMEAITIVSFLLGFDRLKSSGNMCNADMLFKAYEAIKELI